MKSKFSFISRITIAAVAAGSLGMVATLCAQQPAFPPENPYLRRMAATPSPGATAAAKVSTLSAKDKDFLVSAASSGGWEVETGKLAETRAQSDATKKLAARMVTEHSKANIEVVDLAKKKGLAISTENIKAQQFRGGNFDKQYLTLLKQDHQQDIKIFEKEAQSGDDSDVKAWARKMLPVFKEHLAMAEDALSKAQ
jgi:putative membrane protein